MARREPMAGGGVFQRPLHWAPNQAVDRSTGFGVEFPQPALGARQKFFYCELRPSATAWLKSPPDSWELRPGPLSLIPEKEAYSSSLQAGWDASARTRLETGEASGINVLLPPALCWGH